MPYIAVKLTKYYEVVDNCPCFNDVETLRKYMRDKYPNWIEGCPKRETYHGVIVDYKFDETYFIAEVNVLSLVKEILDA